MIRTAVLLALFAGSAADNPSCKKLTVMPKKEFRMGVMKSFADSVENLTDFKEFVESKPACQYECFKKVFPESIDTLIGKIGDDIVKTDSQNIAIQAFTGAFRTCFPGPPRSTVLEAMKKITDGMGDPGMDSAPDISSKGTCPGTTGMGDKDAFMDQVEVLIDNAIKKVVDKSPDLKEFFGNVMLKCQGDCIGKNLEQAVLVNWNMGTLGDEDKVTASIEGSIKSCLPGVPYKDVKDFVKELNDEVNAQYDETSRLYQTGPILDRKAGQNSGMMTLIAAVGGVCALSLGIFAAGLRVGKKFHQRQQANADARLIEVGDIE